MVEVPEVNKNSRSEIAVGRVSFLSEELSGARALSSCCVGAEAKLEVATTRQGRQLLRQKRFEKTAVRDGFQPLINSG